MAQNRSKAKGTKIVNDKIPQNSIELMNEDPLLSEFKYHFILCKVYMPRTLTLEQFAQNIHLGFKIPSLTPNSVYIVQMVNVYDQDRVDLAVGFRRDEHAMKIAREVYTFEHMGVESKVELSNGFRIFMQELQKEEKKNEHQIVIGTANVKANFEDKFKHKDSKKVVEKPQKEMNDEKEQDNGQSKQKKKPLKKINSSLSKNQSSNEQKKQNNEPIKHREIENETNKQTKQRQQRSRSRSRQKHQRKKDVRERFTHLNKFGQPLSRKISSNKSQYKIYLSLVPLQVKRNEIIGAIQKKNIEMSCITSYEWNKNPSSVPYLQIVLKKFNACEKLLQSVLRIGSSPILVLEEEQNPREELLNRQVVYENSSVSKPTMSQLIKDIKSAFGNQVTIVNILACQQSFIVTFFSPIRQLSSYTLEGWHSRRNTNIKPFLERPSLSNQWFSLLPKQTQKD